MSKRHNKRQSDCPDPEDIVAYLRNELDLREQSRVHDHLAGCSSCRAVAENFRGTIDKLENVEEKRLVRDLTPAVLAQIPETAWQQDKDIHFTHRTLFPILMLRLTTCLIVALGSAYVVHRMWQRHHATPPDEGALTHTTTPVLKQHEARKEGLLWLVRVQDSSGKWDPDQWGGRREYTIGLTGMALLSLARSDEDFLKKLKSIDQAVDFLLSQQHIDGRFGDEFDGTMYNHGIATVALLETYGKNKDPDLEEPLRKALDFIRRQQLPSGGWGYRKHSGEMANTSISTWPLQALLISAELGREDEGHALKRGLAWLVGVVDERGQFGYQQPRHFPHGPNALTAMGAYCVLRASKEGIAVDRRLLHQVEQALSMRPPEKPKANFYRTYFQVCALKEADKKQYADSVSDLQQELLSKRQQSGTNKGSWDPQDQWGTVGGRIYSTAMAALSLEGHSVQGL